MNKRLALALQRFITVIVVVAFALANVRPISIVRADDPPDTGTPAATEGGDVITGGEGDSTINAGGGDDIVNGNGGNDVINGGTGDDILNGGAGDDVINGEEGDDTITGGTGEDILDGGAGTDTLVEVMTEGTSTTTSGTSAPEVNDLPEADDPVCIALFGNCSTSPRLGNTLIVNNVNVGTTSNGSYTSTTTSETAVDMTLTDTSLVTTTDISTNSGTITTTETPYSSTVETLTYTFVNPNPPGWWYLVGCASSRPCAWKVTSGPTVIDSGTAVTQSGSSTSSLISTSNEVDTLSNFEGA
ncbi:MAG: hypothetical protein CVU43_09935, partial [Chloroflexi bacterium HGW-Chloroflexi-5]